MPHMAELIFSGGLCEKYSEEVLPLINCLILRGCYDCEILSEEEVSQDPLLGAHIATSADPAACATEPKARIEQWCIRDKHSGELFYPWKLNGIVGVFSQSEIYERNMHLCPYARSTEQRWR